MKLLVMMPERRAGIRREYEMRLAEEMRFSGSQYSDYANLWRARIATLDTVNAAMTEVDLDAVVVDWIENHTNIVACGDIAPDCQPSDVLLAHTGVK